MRFDFDISMRIKDKRTGDIISGSKVIPAPASDYDGYEEICWWNSSMFLDIPVALFKICSKYTGKEYPITEGAAGNAIVFAPKLLCVKYVLIYLVDAVCWNQNSLRKETGRGGKATR